MMMAVMARAVTRIVTQQMQVMAVIMRWVLVMIQCLAKVAQQLVQATQIRTSFLCCVN